MKVKVLISLFGIGMLLGSGVLIGKLYEKSQKRKQETIGQKQFFPIVQNKDFVIIVTSYDNSEWCERNLQSALCQNYPNYRIIYVDDCSTDDTYLKVKRLIASHPQGHRITLIHNEQRKGALENFYNVIWSCKDEEIIIILDGDDWFPPKEILQILNRYYANPKVWLTYSQYREFPSNKEGNAQPFYKEKVKQLGFRKQQRFFFHLKTFYAGLFKKVRKEDLFYQGQFFPAATDVAFMFPMLEMSGEHIVFIPEVLYVFNRANPIAVLRIKPDLRRTCEQYLRTLSPYEPLKNRP